MKLNSSVFSLIAMAISALIILLSSSYVLAEQQDQDKNVDPSFKLTLGLGPNFSRFDAVNDELKSDIGFSIWGDYLFRKNWNLSLGYDHLRFGSDVSYQGLLLGLGYRFSPDSFYDPYFVIGYGVGNSKNIPNSTANQTPRTYQLKGGFGFMKLDSFNLGLSCEYLYIDLDDNLAKQAQIVTPYLTFSYAFSDRKQDVIRSSTKDFDSDGVFNDKDLCPNTKMGDRVNSYGCTINEKVDIQIMINFPTNSAIIPESEFGEARQFAEFLNTHPEIKYVEIEGHTDSVGTKESNKLLSQNRADSVKNLLVKYYGVSTNRLKAIGYGLERPIATNQTEEGRYKNRRVIATFKSGE